MSYTAKTFNQSWTFRQDGTDFAAQEGHMLTRGVFGRCRRRWGTFAKSPLSSRMHKQDSTSCHRLNLSSRGGKGRLGMLDAAPRAGTPTGSGSRGRRRRLRKRSRKLQVSSAALDPLERDENGGFHLPQTSPSAQQPQQRGPVATRRPPPESHLWAGSRGPRAITCGLRRTVAWQGTRRWVATAERSRAGRPQGRR